MSKKNYVMLAKTINQFLAGPVTKKEFEQVLLPQLMYELKQDNGKFDCDRFRRACLNPQA